MRKKISCLLLVLLTAGLYLEAAVGQPEQAETTQGEVPGWQKNADEKITLDWYVNYSWFVTGWGNNLVSQTITEETGVNVNFITPMGNEEEKLNALISSDSLPDIITLGWWEPQVEEMITKDMVYPLNELADEYDAFFYQVSDPDVVNWYTRQDGNIYCYPCSAFKPQDMDENYNITSNQTFLVRKDIYEAIGSPDMTTPEGFMAAVKKAAEMFPTVDGEPLIPIGAHVFDDMGCVSFDKYLQNFLAVPYEKDGKYYDRNTDPEYIRWLKMFRQLGEEGYLADDIFVDQRTQMSEKLADGRYFCMLYQRTDVADQQKILYQNDPDKIYIAIDGPRNSNGDDHVLPVGSINGWTVTLISKNCKDPERAIQFLDYMMSEHGQKLIYLGVEGVTYDTVGGRAVLRDEVKRLLNSDRKTYDELYGADDAYWMLQDNVMQLRWHQEPDEPIRQMERWTYPYAQYLGQYETQISEDTEIGMAYTKINKLWSQTLPRLLLAESEEEFDEILDNFKAEREALGYEQVLDEQTRQMNENKEKLGIE